HYAGLTPLMPFDGLWAYWWRTISLPLLTSPGPANRLAELSGRRLCLGFFLFVLPLPIPGDPDADFVKQQQGYCHQNLGDDLRCGEERAEDKRNDDDIAAG